MNLSINGATLHVEVLGQENKEAIFFIHGGPGLGDCRGDVLTFGPLADRYRLVFMDMRGSGRSSDDGPFTHEQWVADIDAVREWQGLEKINLHGSSYGGFLAQEYALAYPERVAHLFLNVTSPDNQNEKAAINNALSSDLSDISEEDIHRLFEGQVKSNEEFKEMYRAIQPLYVMNFDKEKAEERINSIFFHYETHNEAFQNLVNFDLKDRLPEIEAKVLVTSGKHDWITPPECGRAIHERLKNSAFMLFDDYGHSLVREQGESYIDLLVQFLNGEIETGQKEYVWKEGEVQYV